MNKLPSDLCAATFGREFLAILDEYGFGVLGRAEIEALIFHALKLSSESLADADSFQRAEILRITDQKCASVSRRAAMWLSADDAHRDNQALVNCIGRALQAYSKAPDEKELRIVLDDELERRNIVKELERVNLKDGAIPIAVKVSGRHLILRGTDVDQMIERAERIGELPPAIKTQIAGKKGLDRRRALLKTLSTAGNAVVTSVASACCSGLM